MGAANGQASGQGGQGSFGMGGGSSQGGLGIGGVFSQAARIANTGMQGVNQAFTTPQPNYGWNATGNPMWVGQSVSPRGSQGLYGNQRAVQDFGSYISAPNIANLIRDNMGNYQDTANILNYYGVSQNDVANATGQRMPNLYTYMNRPNYQTYGPNGQFYQPIYQSQNQNYRNPYVGSGGFGGIMGNLGGYGTMGGMGNQGYGYNQAPYGQGGIFGGRSPGLPEADDFGGSRGWTPRNTGVATNPITTVTPNTGGTTTTAPVNYDQMVTNAYNSIGRTGFGDAAGNIDRAGYDWWTNQLKTGAISPNDFNNRFLSGAASVTDPTYSQYANAARGLLNTQNTAAARTLASGGIADLLNR